jgi:hypothetical protein
MTRVDKDYEELVQASRAFWRDSLMPSYTDEMVVPEII